MGKYVEVRRDPLPGKCIHTIRAEDEAGGGGEGGDSSNGSGEADVKIEPALRSNIETINNNTVITYGPTAKTIWRMDVNNLGWDTDKVSNYGFAFSCSEAL